MPYKYKKLSALFMLFAFMMSLSGCESVKKPVPASQEQTEITVGLTYTPDIQFAPVYIAQTLGYFKDAGIKVTLRHHGAQESLFGAIEQGKEDMVFAGADEMAVASSTGLKVRVFQTIYQHYPLSIIMYGKKKITKLEQLNNLKVGIPGEFGESYYAYKYLANTLKTHNISITKQDVGWTGQAALASKKVDAIIGFTNNDAVQLEKNNIPITVLTMKDITALTEKKQKANYTFPIIGASFGVGKKYEYATEVQNKFAQAIKKSLEYIATHPSKTVKYCTNFVPQLASPQAAEKALVVLEKTIELYGTPAERGKLDLSKWPAMLAFLHEQGFIKNKLTVEQLTPQ